MTLEDELRWVVERCKAIQGGYVNTFDEMVDFYRRTAHDMEDALREMGQTHMWGFGTSHNQRSTFVDEQAHDAYMEHVRLCPKRHDPRGRRYGGCAEVMDAWFATDSAEEP